MEIQLSWNTKRYRADLGSPLEIAIPLKPWPDQPNCFFAPPYEAYPLENGDFIGSVAEGAPVNFFNIRLNPHGNGTHTECAGHITKEQHSLQKALKVYHCIAELVSVYPQSIENGDRMVTETALKAAIRYPGAEALILRTLPNHTEKRTRKYSGTNPPYIAPQAMRFLHTLDYTHLLVDLPSVDREEDGGAMIAHKIFWQMPKNLHFQRTITELIFVDNSIRDGIYLLNMQIAGFDLDVSPSKPVMYRLDLLE